MPTINVEGKTFDVEKGKRLVLALEENGIRVGHRCGGNAKCTTCRVEFQEGEPDKMTAAEYAKLKERGLFGQYRLSCQITCEQDMTLTPVMTADNQPAWNGDTGPQPDPQVKPEAVWHSQETLEGITGA
jgi:ferredoxin